MTATTLTGLRHSGDGDTRVSTTVSDTVGITDRVALMVVAAVFAMVGGIVGCDVSTTGEERP